MTPFPPSVTDTLDDVLHIAGANSKKKSAKKVVPAGSKSTGGLFDLDDTPGNDIATNMGNDDIMKYIQQNQTAGDDDLDLFS